MTRPIYVPKKVIIFPTMGSTIELKEYRDNNDVVIKTVIEYSPAIPSGKGFLIFKGQLDEALSILARLAQDLNAVFVDDLP